MRAVPHRRAANVASTSPTVDVIGAIGKPTKSRRGEPSLAADEVELLAKIRRPLPDTFHGLTDVEERYRRRYLDLLMNEETRRDTMLRSRMVTSIRAYLDSQGFVEVETPVLQPRYGGGFAEPFVTHSNLLDRDLYLRIADELYLKRLIVGGLEKVYELAKDFRNEGISYKHSPEFTQLEWYEAYADYNDTAERLERLGAHAAQGTIGGARGGRGASLMRSGSAPRKIKPATCTRPCGVVAGGGPRRRRNRPEREVPVSPCGRCRARPASAA